MCTSKSIKEKREKKWPMAKTGFIPLGKGCYSPSLFATPSFYYFVAAIDSNKKIEFKQISLLNQTLKKLYNGHSSPATTSSFAPTCA
jgi:hypothetical protein